MKSLLGARALGAEDVSLGPWTISIFVSAILFACAPADLRGEPQVSDEQKRLADFHFAGMWDSRERLRSGVFRAVGRRSTRKGDSRIPEEYFVAFDLDRESLRFDRKQGSRFTQYAKNALESVLYVAGSGGACRYAPDWKVDVPDATPFDIRTIGLVSSGEFHYRCSLSDLREFLTKRTKLSDVVRESDTLYRLSCDYQVKWPTETKPEDYVRTIWIDGGKSFSPVRTEIRATHYQQDGSPLTRVECSTETTWIELSGIWVPQECVFSEHGGRSRFVVSVDWESVNKRVPDSTFELQGLDLPEGTSVVNQRLGRPIVESTIGSKSAAALEETSARWRLWLVAANILFIGVIAALVYYRRRRRE